MTARATPNQSTLTHGGPVDVDEIATKLVFIPATAADRCVRACPLWSSRSVCVCVYFYLLNIIIYIYVGEEPLRARDQWGDDDNNNNNNNNKNNAPCDV